MSMSPEEAIEISDAWRKAERHRVKWLWARPAPTDDQALEAEIIEARHRVEDEANASGLLSSRTALAMDEEWRLLQLQMNLDFLRLDWKDQIRRVLEEEETCDRWLAWSWFKHVCPALRSLRWAQIIF